MQAEPSMKVGIHIASLCFLVFGFIVANASSAHGQVYGIELHNSMMPASGGMAGTSISRPQDLQSALNKNPATLTQFKGTQFAFGGGYAEPTITANQANALPLVTVDPYSGKSHTPGSLVGNIGISQDIDAFGIPATFGLGFLTNAGLGVDYRHIPNSKGTTLNYLALDLVAGGGLQLTDRLALGSAVFIGTSYLNAPFIPTQAVTPDVGIRASLGVNYDLTCHTSIGAYWQSEKGFQFRDAILVGNAYRTIEMQHPENAGLGIANDRLLDGRLLLAADMIWINHSDADTLKAVYVDQMVYQVGAQLAATDKLRLRTGYAYNQNPMRNSVPGSIGGVVPIGEVPAVQYFQAQFASICQHRMTAGVGLVDVLPGLDLDIMGGGMFKESQTFGSTTVSLQSYWIGFGLTWRFNRGSCEGGWCASE